MISFPFNGKAIAGKLFNARNALHNLVSSSALPIYICLVGHGKKNEKAKRARGSKGAV